MSSSSVNKDNNNNRITDHPMTIWALTGQRLIDEKTYGPIKPRDDLQLLGAQIFFRHGARTPLNFLPGLEEVTYTKEHIDSYPPTKHDIKLITMLKDQVVSQDKISSASHYLGDRIRQLKSATGEKIVVGQLTAIGEKQLFELGRLVQSELMGDKGVLPDTYDPKVVYCRSTYMDRTLASARSFMAGLFTKDDKLLAKDPFEIETHHFPDETLFPNPNVYPILNKCHDAKSLYSTLHEDHELKRVREKMIKHVGGENHTHYGIIELHDDIISRQAHNFPVAQELIELTKEFDVMAAREYIMMATNIGYNIFVRSTFGPILYLITKNFEALHRNYVEEKETGVKKAYHKLYIYSGHDSTLIPLAMALDIFDMRWPRYASYIFMKYYVSKTNPNETFVTVNFAGQPQILPNSDDFYCPYSTLLKNLEDRIEKPKATPVQPPPTSTHTKEI